MKKVNRKSKMFFSFWMITIVLLVSFIHSQAIAGNVVTASLSANPLLASKAGKVNFKATIFKNDEFYAKPGEMVQVMVTTKDFSWVSDKHSIKYPASGNIIVNFSEKFTIPTTAKGGQVFEFYLVNKIWWPMSQKVSVKVMSLRKKDTRVFNKSGKLPDIKKKKEVRTTE